MVRETYIATRPLARLCAGAMLAAALVTGMAPCAHAVAAENLSASTAASQESAPTIASAQVTAIPDQTYTGETITYSPVVTLDGTTLAPGIDYKLSYGENTEVGTGTVTITGTGDYAGTKTVAFRITGKPISSASVSAIARKYYTGSPITPVPTVKDGAVTLVEGIDYTLSYQHNKAIGRATVTIKGKGNYAGAKKVAFPIVKYANTLTVETSTELLPARALVSAKRTVQPISVSHEKGAVTYSKVSKGSSGCLTVSPSTGKVTVRKGTLQGTYRIKIKVTAAGNEYYYPKTETVTATVTVK